MIPAATNTYIVQPEGGSSLGFVKTPVIGWLMNNENRPDPITLDGRFVLVGGAAVLSPCGMVTSSNDSFAFENVEEWLESNPGSTKKHPTAEAQTAPEVAQGDAGAVMVEDDDGSPYRIDWTGDLFKQNSFWHYDDGEYEFVFQIAGGEQTPKASKVCTKIKRTEMMELKKSVDMLGVEDILNARPLPSDGHGEETTDADDMI